MTDWQPFTLSDFVRESNRIEGIVREPTVDEIQAHEHLLSLPGIHLGHMEAFVETIAGAPLRRRRGMNVRVGDHIAPDGGPEIEDQLRDLLILCDIHGACRIYYAYETHITYENLHPFMDGNGRSGRALWLWMMGGMDGAPLGFLHHWYYQTLAEIER